MLGIVAAVLVMGLLSQESHTASAAAAPVTQCNHPATAGFNVGGQGIACTVIIENYVTAAGAPSGQLNTVTVTRCLDVGGVTTTLCTPTTTTTSAEPVTVVQQCNDIANGGGSVLICAVTIRNHFTGSPAGKADAAVFQCSGSVITGTGAPGFCNPLNNVGSVAAATVGQCNDSGNGGTSVEFRCTVTAGSTMTSTLPVKVLQCNNSANGGGALTRCTATVTNEVGPGSATATPTGSATAATATPTGSVTATPTGSATATPTGSATATPTGVATTTPTRSATDATSTPTGSATVVRPPAPLPPATGNAGFVEGGGTSQPLIWLLGIATFGLVLAGWRLVSRRI